MGIYQHNEYRKALREIIEDQKATDKTVNFGSYAEAIGVQKTFVSKVLGGNAHLSEDQFYLTMKYLRFPSDKAKYLRLLYDYSRTGLHARKKEILGEIRNIQEEQRQFRIHTSASLQQPEVSQEIVEYYLEPLNLIVHAYLGIHKFAMNPQLIANELGLQKTQLAQILQCLKRSKIVNYDSLYGEVQVIIRALHLDAASIFNRPHQQIFRLRCLEQVTQLSPSQRFVFSLTFSGNQTVKKQIQEFYLEFIKRVEKLLDTDQSYDEVYQINFDLFPWSKLPKE